ncbi:TPA: hypothetical protein EYP75_00780 [Candidatus Bathyarchaeota archaeon]|nr:hypothetical protein [Candidatus Bathyarchaeota archaeon]
MSKRKFSSKVDSETASKILRSVSVQESFLFFLDIGQYTGEFAQSLEAFYEAISNLPSESLDFHFRRRDFEKWIREILGDAYLADRISRIDKSVRGGKLRTRLKGTVKRRLNQLKAAEEK